MKKYWPLIFLFMAIGLNLAAEVKSSFKNHQLLDVSGLPELSMSSLHIELPYKVKDIKKEVVIYEDLYNLLLISPLILPRVSLEVTALGPRGVKFVKKYRYSELEILEADPYGGYPYDRPIIEVPFNCLAAFPDGDWHIRINIDGKKNIRKTLTFKMAELSIASVPTPNPFDYNSAEVFEAGDTIYIYGNTNLCDIPIQVALYHLTYEQKADFSRILKPAAATRVQTDEEGRFYLEFVIGSDMPKGEYKMAFGSIITEIIQFGLWFNLVEKK